MQGYYKMPDETKETLSDGWLKTGDLGYVDEEGFVFLTGRKKNLIITKNRGKRIAGRVGKVNWVKAVIVQEDSGERM